MTDPAAPIALTGVVVTHPDRYYRACELRRKICASHMTIDNGRVGAFANHARALRVGATGGATHVLTIEDDALPVDDLMIHVEQAVRRRPSNVIGLYVGSKHPERWAPGVARAAKRAAQHDAAWLWHHKLLWGVATVYPVDLIEPILNHPDVQGSDKPYDQRISRATPDLGGVYYTWPSLVDHDDTQPSIVNCWTAQEPGRVARRVGIPDWNEQIVEIA